MTAAHALAEKHVAQHAAVKESTRRFPKVRLPKRDTTPKVTVRNAATGKVSRVTPTGKALYSVTTRGEVNRNLVARSAGGFATFASAAGDAVDSAYPNHWFLQLFETTEQRNQRINAQAVATSLQLLAVGITKLTRR